MRTAMWMSCEWCMVIPLSGWWSGLGRDRHGRTPQREVRRGGQHEQAAEGDEGQLVAARRQRNAAEAGSDEVADLGRRGADARDGHGVLGRREREAPGAGEVRP